MTYTANQVIELMEKEKVRYIRLYFTDILGQLKGMSITRSEIAEVLEQGQGFDGSSIEGFVRIEESDLMARPDLQTFRIFPWEVAGVRVAMMFCDIETPDGKPYEGDPRWVLRRMLAKAAEYGYTFYVGPELEYFYFRQNDGPELLDAGGYFDYATVDIGTRARKKAVVALESIGVAVECSHHEVAPSQHEIDLKYQSALKMADFAMIYRLVVKEMALADGIYATFMPKPLANENGSGMHCHQSLFAGDQNIFFDADAPYNLSEIGKHYVAGILRHIRSFTLVTNQWVNSYKRLVPGYEAPCYVSWGRRNRSSLVRVPMYRPGREQASRVELRSPDSSCNPYLAFALMLAAGLDGMEQEYECPPPVEDNIFDMTRVERRAQGIRSLPNSLENAIIAFRESELMRETLGDHIFNNLIANKWVEWDRYRLHVSQYEIDQYLPIL
ncbi:MAG: glutamine synthetase [candidate division Zixibacteria bacterium]|nr:glutamine synthetase [candidate division Zixibacteria bacterium]